MTVGRRRSPPSGATSTTSPDRRASAKSWRTAEAICELFGTAIVIFAVVAANVVAPDSAGPAARSGIVGAFVAGSSIAVLLSPLGRRSGGHLNPAVSLALWVTHNLNPRGLISYVLAQSAGVLLGLAVGRAVFGGSVAHPPIYYAQLTPAWSPGWAALLEATLTGLLVMTILFLLSHARLVRFTPWVASAGFGLAIWAAGPRSGGALSPIRALGPDFIVDSYPLVWVYIVGPLAGAVVAAVVHGLFGLRPLTSKVNHHSPRPWAWLRDQVGRRRVRPET